MAERSIAGADLIGMLPEVFEEIANNGTVFMVNMGKAPGPDVIRGLVGAVGEIVFALGPSQVLHRVFGLIDAEYGWPRSIQVSEVGAVSDPMPGYRRHPMIYRGRDCLAMSISLGEYSDLLKKT